jgi:hypothetical protein
MWYIILFLFCGIKKKEKKKEKRRRRENRGLTALAN